MQTLVLAKNDFAWGEPAGFYPGRGEGASLGTDYSAWLTKNQAGIADIQSRIVEIKHGTRAPGCIGEDKYTCIATLSQRLTIADEWMSETNVFPVIKYDVNGRPINGSTIMLQAFLPDAKALHDGGKTEVILDVTPQGSVSRIFALLAHDPLVAHTQEEYNKTQVYEIVAAVTMRACPALSKPEVAKWIENLIKPGITYGKPGHLDDDMVSGRAEHSESKKTVFCGRTFQFNSSSGYYHEGFQRVAFEGGSLEIR
jgi:hypothetical protein